MFNSPHTSTHLLKIESNHRITVRLNDQHSLGIILYNDSSKWIENKLLANKIK